MYLNYKPKFITNLKQVNVCQCSLEITIEQVSEHKLIGVAIDDQLRWQTHAHKTFKALYKNTTILDAQAIQINSCKIIVHSHHSPANKLCIRSLGWHQRNTTIQIKLVKTRSKNPATWHQLLPLK